MNSMFILIVIETVTVIVIVIKYVNLILIWFKQLMANLLQSSL